MALVAMCAMGQANQQTPTTQTQAPQQFEVAAIRLNNTGPGPGTSVRLSEGRLSITNEPIRMLIRQAFKLQDEEILGGPAWLDSDRYDIEAKTGQAGQIAQSAVTAMVQDLLAERFHLKYHRETRELTVYALTSEGKASSGLKPSKEGETTSTNTDGAPGHPQKLRATATTMEMFSGYVGNRLGRIVVDQTGLQGGYDFMLNWTQGEAGDSGLPSLVTALHEQLGLKLQQKKTPVGVLVIDSIDRPTEN